VIGISPPELPDPLPDESELDALPLDDDELDDTALDDDPSDSEPLLLEVDSLEDDPLDELSDPCELLIDSEAEPDEDPELSDADADADADDPDAEPFDADDPLPLDEPGQQGQFGYSRTSVTHHPRFRVIGYRRPPIVTYPDSV
jgi:hypothetical protein